MDLDELKHMWQSKQPDLIADKPWQFPGSIGKRWRSKHPVDRIRKKLILENLAGLVLAIPFLLFFGAKDVSINAYAFYGFVVIVIASLTYATTVIIKYENAYSFSNSAHQFISTCLTIIKGYIRILTISSYVLLPVSLLIGFVAGLSLNSDDDFTEALVTPLGITLISVGVLGFIILFVVFIKLYYKALYGRNISELEDCLQQLSHNDDNF